MAVSGVSLSPRKLGTRPNLQTFVIDFHTHAEVSVVLFDHATADLSWLLLLPPASNGVRS